MKNWDKVLITLNVSSNYSLIFPVETEDSVLTSHQKLLILFIFFVSQIYHQC